METASPTAHFPAQGCGDYRRGECLPGEISRALACLPRPVRIVELQHAGLLVHTGGAEARRVIGVALDLGWPPGMTFDQESGGVATEHHRRGVVLGQPWGELGRR